MSARYPGIPCCNEGQCWWNRKHEGSNFYCNCCGCGYCRTCTLNRDGGYLDTCALCSVDLCDLCVAGKCENCNSTMCTVCYKNQFQCAIESCKHSVFCSECAFFSGLYDIPCVDCGKRFCSNHVRYCTICDQYHCTNCDDTDFHISDIVCRFCNKNNISQNCLCDYICRKCRIDIDNPKNELTGLECDDDDHTNFDLGKSFRCVNEILTCYHCVKLFPINDHHSHIHADITEMYGKSIKFLMHKSFEHLKSHLLWNPNSARVKRWAEDKTREHGMT